MYLTSIYIFAILTAFLFPIIGTPKRNIKYFCSLMLSFGLVLLIKKTNSLNIIIDKIATNIFDSFPSYYLSNFENKLAAIDWLTSIVFIILYIIILAIVFIISGFFIKDEPVFKNHSFNIDKLIIKLLFAILNCIVLSFLLLILIVVINQIAHLQEGFLSSIFNLGKKVVESL